MSLNEYTDQQLLEELENRKKLRDVARPKVVDNPDWSKVIADAEEMVEIASKLGTEDRGFDYVRNDLLIHVLDALFGDRNLFWAYVEACRLLGRAGREER